MCSVCLGPHGRKCLEAVVAEGYLRGMVRECSLGPRGEKGKSKRMDDSRGEAKLRIEGRGKDKNGCDKEGESVDGEEWYFLWEGSA